MYYLAFISIVLAYVCEAISHGMKNWLHRKSSIRLQISIEKKYTSRWKILNVMFQILLVSGVVLLVTSNYINFGYGINPFKEKGYWIDAVYIAIYIASIRFCVFKYIHNIAFKENIFYVGTVAKNDRLNRVIRNFFPPTFELMFKVFVLVIVFIDMCKLYY